MIGLGGIFILLVSILSIFVLKVSGSDDIDSITGCTPYNVSLDKGDKNFQVKINWSTKDECLGYVLYGDDREKLDLVAIDTQKLSSRKHEVVIDSLLSSKTYYFLINSDETNYGDSGIPLSFSLSSL